MCINVRQKQKYWNWNGCCILTHVTEREAVACFDHEKYCQIGHTSTCHPKFDIVVLILLISFCVWRPGNGAIFTHWTDQSQIGLFLDNRATRCQYFLLCTHRILFALFSPLQSALTGQVKGASSCKSLNSGMWLSPRIRSVTKCVQVHVWWWLMLKGNGHGVAFARGNVFLPHSHPLPKLQ